MLNLRLLHYLVTVAEQGTMAAAAEQLHVAQPAVLRQLRGLEASLGLTLFEKEGRRLVLTPGGRQFVDVARDLLRRSREAEAAAEHFAQGKAPRLVIAASMEAINEIVAPALADFLPTSGAHVDFVACRASEAIGFLGDRADLAIGTAPATERYESRMVGRLPLLAQFVPTAEWAGLDSLHIREAVRRPLVLLSGEHRIRQRIDDVVNAAGVAYSSIVECSVPRAAQSLAAAGRGVTLLTDLPVFGLRALPLRDDAGPLELLIHASWPRNHYATEEIRHLVDVLEAYYTQWVARATD